MGKAWAGQGGFWEKSRALHFHRKSGRIVTAGAGNIHAIFTFRRREFAIKAPQKETAMTDIHSQIDAILHDFKERHRKGEPLEPIEDREIALSGKIPLEYCVEALRGDKEVVLARMRLYGGDLRDAAPAMQNDPEVVETAILSPHQSPCGNALIFAGPVARANLYLVALAASKDRTAIFQSNVSPQAWGAIAQSLSPRAALSSWGERDGARRARKANSPSIPF
jgi:hypothetical protein